MIFCTVAGQTQADERLEKRPQGPSKPPAVLQLSPEQFIKRFDKDHDGQLSRDEVPPRIAQAFDRFDRNGDGKLDRREVAAMLETLRRRFGVTGRQAGQRPGLDRMVNNILERLDANKDGMVSKEEARGPLARNFERLDTNHDGFLDRGELRQAAERLLAARRAGGRPGAKGGPGTSAPGKNSTDFEALDLNADGRLTPDELKGTPYALQFDAIDTNKDGKIDRKEFNAYLKKVAVQKGP
jgi:Ca2+-binding EF-hand superfamily protein